MAKTRPFNRINLAALAVPEIRPPMGVGALVWRYVVFLPLSEQKLGAESLETIADGEDIENLRTMLSDDFGGVTILLRVTGYGLRDPTDPTSLELNRNLPFMVYARPVAAADRYFEGLEKEMRDAFNQGVILVERQEAFLFASANEQPTAGKRSPSRRGKRR
jgi:hypothetical protein